MKTPTPKILIKGEGRDEWQKRYFKFAVRGIDKNIPPFSAQEITENSKGLFAELNNAGASAFSPSARTEVLNRLDQRRPTAPTFKVVTRLGWNSGAFVLPGQIIGQASRTLEPSFRHLDTQEQLLAKYHMKGTLQDWQGKIGELCSGNSRLMFCASLALTGPILPLVNGPRSGGFQLFGLAESGKTAAAMVAGSIWGCHRSKERREKGFAESWNTTVAKVEITALAHNETVLVLDDTKKAGSNDKDRAKVVIDISFGLAEGVERERLTNVRSARGWRLYFLSTSNYSLTELASRADLEIDDAERGRFVDIPAPSSGHGIYENLREFTSGQKFTDSLKIRCRKFCGAVGCAFVCKLVQDRANDADRLKQFLKSRRQAYLQAINAKAQAERLNPLNRASGRFATVFAAGSLAIKYRIFRWDQAALLQAILACQLDGLRLAKAEHTARDRSVSGLQRRLIAYLRDHHTKFLDLNKTKPRLGAHKPGSAPGYIAKFKSKSWFYLTSHRLKKIIGNDTNAKSLKKELVAKNLMASTSGGRDLVQRPFFSGVKGNKGHVWIHAFRSRMLKQHPEET
jgi:putative DNA primase/helicase